MNVVCAYGLRARKRKGGLPYIQHKRWEGTSTDFFPIHVDLESQRELGCLTYAVAIVRETGDRVYEFGSKEDIDHAENLLNLTS